MSVTSMILLAALSQQPATPPPAPPMAATRATAANDALSMQVALDRAGFSPGVLDGRAGGNTKKALDAYTKANGGPPPAIEPTAKYRITDADAAGPFEPQIPTDLVEQSKLKALGYRNLLEALAERYHSTPALLQRLNPGATFTAGEEITVPNVDPMQVPVDPPKPVTKPTPAEKKAEAQAAQQAAKEKPAVTV